MQEIKIQLHIINTIYDRPHFFILAKGFNAGRPSANPFVNSYVVIANDEIEKGILFWICFSLWKSDRFLKEVKGTPDGFNPSLAETGLNHYCRKLANQPELFLSMIREFKLLIKSENLLTAQIKLIKRTKKALAKRMLLL